SIKVHSIAIVFIDMNGFKRINDTYGHEVGDQLLERFVSRLNDFLRDTDLLCRLGGDEFIILSSNIDIENLESLLEKIQLVLDKPMNMNNLEIKVSASIGWSYSTEVSNADLEEMIKEADKAMYKAKGSELLSGDL
ncbi:GGDEF domain-containing protein, partial [Butyricicoccus sp. 1XD8-22]